MSGGIYIKPYLPTPLPSSSSSSCCFELSCTTSHKNQRNEIEFADLPSSHAETTSQTESTTPTQSHADAVYFLPSASDLEGTLFQSPKVYFKLNEKRIYFILSSAAAHHSTTTH